MMTNEDVVRAGKNSENVEFCKEQGHACARQGIFRYWATWSAKPNGIADWKAANDVSMSQAVEKMRDAMTAAGLAAWIEGFQEVIAPFIAQRIKII
jgi:hypothetical protein